MRIPLLDLGRLHETIRDELLAAVADVVDRSAFVGSDPVREFERAFGAAHGLGPGAGCGSGTDALTLALRAFGVGPGDEVIVPSMTFVATAEAVVHVGATPVLADVDPVTLLIDPNEVKQLQNERTRAVIPVHLYGHVVPFDHIESFKAAGLTVIEDAAQAHLATWQGRSLASAGDAACFSFYPGKNLGALGDGGMVLSSDPAIVETVARLRNHGRSDKYEHTEIGWCSRLDGLQAAVLSVKLRYMEEWNAGRVRVAERYRRHLGASDVTSEALVPWEEGAVHHLLVARTASGKRERIKKVLASAGIGSGFHYPIALSDQPALAPWARPTPTSEAAAASVLSLPMDPLMTDDEVDEVCDRFVAAYG